MNRDLKDHQVHVLHKCVTGEDGKRTNTLAVGQTFIFPRSNSAYQVQEDGSVRAQAKKFSKAERKQMKRARILDRHLATANIVEAHAAAPSLDSRLQTQDSLHASALAALPVLTEGDRLPEDIQMFPPGDAVEFTLQDYPGEKFTMKVDAAVAAKAQADLQRLLAAEAKGQGSAPFADKNHEDAEATFRPVEIYWAGNDPKSGGVRVKAEWTPFGASLVRAKAFKYFSGNFLFNKTAKKFLGLINENIGGLVNRPGFAAQQAFARADSSKTTNQKKDMTTEDIKSAITEALAPVVNRIDTLEAKAKGATAAATAAELDKDPVIVSLEARIKGLESNTNETVKASAKATVATLGVKAGRIAAQDADTIAFWETSIAANAKAADALAKMPVNPAFAASGAAGGTSTATTGEHEFVGLVAAKAKAGKSKADAVAEAIAENQTAYTSWLKAGAGKL